MGLSRFDVGREDAPLFDELRAAFDRVLSSGRYLFGPEGDALRGEVLRALDAPEGTAAVGVASGTDAITIALMALGIGPGDEVITVANAGVPGPTAIRRAGAEVVFCDVLPETGTIDPASAAAAVGPRTRAVLAVHLYGNLADVAALRAALPGHVVVVEDCAQAFGSRLDGRAAGTLGDAAAFSFYPTKNLGAVGDAGLVIAPREIAERARRLADYGRDGAGMAVELGTMSRMDELQAAALRVKLARFARTMEQRRRLIEAYDASLPEPFARLGKGARGEPVVHLLVVRAAERARVRAALAAEGIETGVHYATPAHRMPAFAGARRTSLAVSERACDEVLSLPLFPSMSLDAVERVCAALERAC